MKYFKKIKMKIQFILLFLEKIIKKRKRNKSKHRPSDRVKYSQTVLHHYMRSII